MSGPHTEIERVDAPAVERKRVLDPSPLARVPVDLGEIVRAALARPWVTLRMPGSYTIVLTDHARSVRCPRCGEAAAMRAGEVMCLHCHTVHREDRSVRGADQTQLAPGGAWERSDTRLRIGGSA